MYFISRYSKLTEWGLSVSPLVRWLASAAVLAAITGLWYMCAYGTLQTRLCQKYAQFEQLKAEQAVFKITAHKADQLETLVNTQKTSWDTTVQETQKQASHATLFGLFDAFGKQGIAVQGYFPRGSIDRTWYTKSSAQLHFATTFDQLLALFDVLNKDTMLYRCESVRLERRDNQIFAVATVSHKTPKGVVNGKA